MATNKILLVDDEQIFLDATAELLRKKGYACDVAVNARSAMDLIEEKEYDAVITDIKMPGNANLEFVESLETHVPKLPVILITGYPSLETAVESVNMDVVAYLVKPVDIDDLLDPVQRAVAKSNTYGLIQTLKDRARQRIQQLDQLEADIDVGNESALLEAIFDMSFQSVADAYVDLRQLFTIMEDRQPESLAVSLRNDPGKQKMIDAFEHAIQVLEKTKQSFKSKQLAALRRQLESVLEEVKV